MTHKFCPSPQSIGVPGQIGPGRQFLEDARSNDRRIRPEERFQVLYQAMANERVNTVDPTAISCNVLAFHFQPFSRNAPNAST